jgi:hypothetical protein
MSDGPFELTRRALGQMMLAMPFAATAAIEEKTEAPVPSPRAECFAATEPALLAEEKARLEKSITDGEKSLAVIRDAIAAKCP